MRRLYFVSANVAGECVFAGHWYAHNPTDAVATANAQAKADVEVRQQHGLPPLDLTGARWKARTSNATHNALNAQ